MREFAAGSSMVTISLIFLLAPFFFSDTFFQADATQYALFVFGFVLLIIQFVKTRCIGGVSLLVVLWATFIVLALIGNESFASGLGRSWFVIFPASVLCLMILSMLPEADWGERLMRIVTLFSFIHALTTIGIWLFPDLYNHFISPIFFEETAHITGAGYKSGLTGHYSTNGIYLALGSMSAFFLCQQNHSNKKLWIVFAIIMFALLLTTKRAHLVFSLIAIGSCYLLLDARLFASKLKKMAIAFTGALLLTMLASAFSPEVGAVLGRLAEGLGDSSFNGRSGFYKLCASMWTQAPILGCGWGSYTLAFNSSHMAETYLSYGYTGMQAHNVYLQVLAEEGLVGLILFLASTFGPLLIGTKLLILDKEQKERNANPKEVLACSVSVQIFFLLYCLTGNPLYDAQIYVPYLLFCAITIVFARKECLRLGVLNQRLPIFLRIPKEKAWVKGVSFLRAGDENDRQ